MENGCQYHWLLESLVTNPGNWQLPQCFLMCGRKAESFAAAVLVELTKTNNDVRRERTVGKSEMWKQCLPWKGFLVSQSTHRYCWRNHPCASWGPCRGIQRPNTAFGLHGWRPKVGPHLDGPTLLEEIFHGWLCLELLPIPWNWNVQSVEKLAASWHLKKAATLTGYLKPDINSRGRQLFLAPPSFSPQGSNVWSPIQTCKPLPRCRRWFVHITQIYVQRKSFIPSTAGAAVFVAVMTLWPRQPSVQFPSLNLFYLHKKAKSGGAAQCWALWWPDK